MYLKYQTMYDIYLKDIQFFMKFSFISINLNNENFIKFSFIWIYLLKNFFIYVCMYIHLICYVCSPNSSHFLWVALHFMFFQQICTTNTLQSTSSVWFRFSAFFFTHTHAFVHAFNIQQQPYNIQQKAINIL